VKIFKGYFKNFMKYLIILLILSIIAYIFTSLPFFAGLCLGITGSMLLSYNWYWNLRNAQLGDGGKVKTGTLTRMLIVTAACLIWVRFPETFNIIGILIGLLLTYALIFWRAASELFKRKR
jgi:ATP synthase I chain.